MIGKTCPRCKNRTFHNRGSHYDCTTCGYVGWPWFQPVEDVGKGRGNRCPWCAALRLHDIKTLEAGIIRRCSRCGYAAFEPTWRE
jgi:hypothetical protein